MPYTLCQTKYEYRYINNKSCAFMFRGTGAHEVKFLPKPLKGIRIYERKE